MIKMPIKKLREDVELIKLQIEKIKLLKRLEAMQDTIEKEEQEKPKKDPKKEMKKATNEEIAADIKAMMEKRGLQ